MLSGLIPNDGSDQEDLKRRLLAGRYSEIRMLYFLGKDVFRWIEQCVEWGQRVPELSGAGIRSQSFAAMLTADPPEAVKEKLVRWGVADYVSIFTRAIGLNAMFIQPPAFDALSEEFLRNYHRYADGLCQCYLDSQPYGTVASANFHFELYASGSTRACWNRSGRRRSSASAGHARPLHTARHASPPRRILPAAGDQVGAYSHRKMSLNRGKRIKGSESPFWGFPALGADQREARGAGKLRCVFPSKNGFGFDLPAQSAGRRPAGGARQVRLMRSGFASRCPAACACTLHGQRGFGVGL